jgi:gamma-tubulin complex component 4
LIHHTVRTGLDEGGVAEDFQIRKDLLRCGWGVVRKMCFFLDILLGYVMQDVCDFEFRRLKTSLVDPAKTSSHTVLSPSLGNTESRQTNRTSDPLSEHTGHLPEPVSSKLDFTTIREMHSLYLRHLLEGTLLTSPALTGIIRQIFDTCERLVAQVERWGGDVLPALLFEGSLDGPGHHAPGEIVHQRWEIVSDIDNVRDQFLIGHISDVFMQILQTLLTSFYEQLSLSTTQQSFNAAADVSKSALVNVSIADATSAFVTTFIRRGSKAMDREGEVRRHVERLLLRLDFNGCFSKANEGQTSSAAVSEARLQ